MLDLSREQHNDHDQHRFEAQNFDQHRVRLEDAQRQFLVVVVAVTVVVHRIVVTIFGLP